MAPTPACVLALNGGSSRLKFALYQRDEPPQRWLYGKGERIGLPGTQLTCNDPMRQQQDSRSIVAVDHRTCHGISW